MCVHRRLRGKRADHPKALIPEGVGGTLKMSGSHVLRPSALIAVAGGLFLLVATLAPESIGGVSAQSSTTTLAVDVNTDGNTSTALGTRDLCAQVSAGDTFQVDVTIENVTALTALEAFITYDENVVTVTDRKVKDQFLASAGESNVFDASESVPDVDGRYRMEAAIIPADDPIGADGSGVLARLTLEAKGPGVTTLSLTPSQTDIPDRPVAATLTNVNAAQIGDSDGDSYFDGPILDAQVAVDQACPGQVSNPTVISGGGNDGGIPAWIILAAAAGIITAGAGGAALFVLRRTGRQTS